MAHTRIATWPRASVSRVTEGKFLDAHQSLHSEEIAGVLLVVYVRLQDRDTVETVGSACISVPADYHD